MHEMQCKMPAKQSAQTTLPAGGVKAIAEHNSQSSPMPAARKLRQALGKVGGGACGTGPEEAQNFVEGGAATVLPAFRAQR